MSIRQLLDSLFRYNDKEAARRLGLPVWKLRGAIPDSGMIYVLVSGDRAKIGYTHGENCLSRMRALRTYAPRQDSRIAAAFLGDTSMERELHNMLKHVSRGGEWFEAGVTLATIEEIQR